MLLINNQKQRVIQSSLYNKSMYKQVAITINNGPIKGILYGGTLNESIFDASSTIDECIKSYGLTEECINNDYKEREKTLIDKLIKTEDFAPRFFISPHKEEYNPRIVVEDEITFPPVWKK